MQEFAETVSVRRRWHLWLLAAVVLYAAGAAAVWMFARKRPPFEFERAVTALYQEIKVGDSVERLQGFLRPGRDVSPTDRATFESIVKSIHLPAGHQASDRLLVHEFQNEVRGPFNLFRRQAVYTLTTYLQFRDGRLVNHDPLNYQGPQPPCVATVW